MAPPDYVGIANRKFTEIGRSVIPYTTMSSGYSHKDYNPIAPSYGSSSRKYSSSLEYKCNNC